MSRNGLTRVLAVVVIGILAEGCRVPPVPEHARLQGDPGEPQEGVPLKRILNGFGKPSKPPDSGVVLATAEQQQQQPSTAEMNRQAGLAPPAGQNAPPKDEHSGFQLSDLSPSNLADNLKELVGMGRDEGAARALYREGQTLYGTQDFGEAAARFTSAAARWPDSPLEEDALFMAAESYFFADQYPKANDSYQKLLAKYEYSRHLDKVAARLFAIGRYWEQMDEANPNWPISPNFFDRTRPTFDTWGNAIKAYDMVRMHDPTGPLADDSIMATANAQFLKGHYEEASYQYDLLRKEYPESEHQIPAHVLEMKSKMAMYQGPLYDSGPLETAGEIADETLTQFGPELGKQRDLVLQTRNHVTEAKAARQWAVAQYYDKKKCYGAARVYYRSIIKEYPQTGIAQQAAARLGEIQGFPDQPPNHFKWLTDLFPTEESRSHAAGTSTPLEWIGDLFGGSQRPSEEFRDEPTP